MTIEEKLLDVLADATYACSYWAGRLDYEKEKLTKGKYEYFEERLVDCLMNGGKVTYYDIEDNEPYVLTLDKFKEGIAKLEKEHDWEYWEDYSDEVLQVCLFGKVVFG
ncbi:hypothetical protein SAMN02745671_01131 [Anaerovibrio lipolyticus DSM 3074]|uniref:Uncharacterized protein n=1 Tax=Anaerovibrio lipolyticus DSM 3074 TaxID=1120997 RepID=A0A1M6CIN6_9FIRM|nr:hypothetical protein [Anaerovibrio lipolyticus]SHI60892.1 hypothetical protein SAMN02745671_01131 [Anaerovibrio lipolyticus DSM 3074]